MTPLAKKALFRIRQLKRPPIFSGKQKPIFGGNLKRRILTGLMVLLTISIIHSGKLPIRTDLKEGDIATDDIYAPFNFSYEAGIDEEKTGLAQRSAADNVSDIYNIDPAVFEKAKDTAERFFNDIISIKKSMPGVSDDGLKELLPQLPSAVTLEGVKALLNYDDIATLKETAVSVLSEIFSRPIVSSGTAKTLSISGKKQVTIYDKASGEKIAKGPNELLDISDQHSIIDPVISKYTIKERVFKDILYKLISGWIEPNLIFNSQETETAKKLTASITPPVYNILNRIKGEVVIRKGQRVTKDHLTQLARIYTSYSSYGKFSQLSGIAILIILLLFLLLGYLKYFEPKIYSNNKTLLLIGLSLLFVTISARIIISSPLPSYFIPVAVTPMLLTLLVNGSVAAIVAMIAAIIVALTAGAKFNIFLVSLVGGISAISTIYNARRHGQIIKSGIYVGVLNFITICAIGLLTSFEAKVFLKEGLWGIASGITSAALTMLFLPFLESVFKLVTAIRLIELADLNHPLLKDMVMNAPGTYHHSLVVGNLAEAACDTIAANSLLARVASYYHDIGKTKKAEYFAENQSEPLDMHDKLAPSMSSLIITNHVKDGVELAERHKLCGAIKDIIEQHHGTGLVTYFYHQALEKTPSEDTVSEEGFRYGGPKPQTKEAAVVMLADSVEAASRVLQDPVPQRLNELVRKIINNKFMDRQMDECDLTLRDIDRIAESFVRVLTGIYHSRIEYPTDTADRHANNHKQRAKKDQA